MSIYKDRLLLLADFLDKLPSERFDYTRWISSGWKGNPDLSCGSVACALGWATTIPELRAAGLRLVKADQTGVICMDNVAEYVPTTESCMALHYAEEAAHKVFDLNNLEFEYLFIPREHQDTYDVSDKSSNAYALEYNQQSPRETATAKEVAAHIRFFVENKYWNQS